MVKSAQNRVDKYNAKNDADAIRIRAAAYKETQNANQAMIQDAMVAKQIAVRAILDSAGIAGILSGAYQAVGMKLFGLSRKFSGATLALEINTVLDGYTSKGLNATVLTEIAELFGVTYP